MSGAVESSNGALSLVSRVSRRLAHPFSKVLGGGERREAVVSSRDERYTRTKTRATSESADGARSPRGLWGPLE